MNITKLICCFMFAFSLVACAEKSKWQGTYSYEASLGDNVGADAVIIEYVLSITKNNCSIDINGYQISESIICTTVENEETLQVMFKSFKDGSTKNIYDVQVYPIGGVLLSLSMREGQVVTTWFDLLPDESLDKTGHYFVKQ